MFTKAIDLDQSNPIFFSNWASCYFELSQFDKSVADCNEAIKLNPQFIKGYYKKALALREQLKEEEAI